MDLPKVLVQLSFHVNYLSVNGLCKGKYSEEILYSVHNMHKVLFSFASSKDSMGTIVSLNVRWCCPACWRRWKNYQCCLPAAPQCLAASSIHICLNSGCHLHVLAHLRFQPGGSRSSLLTHWTIAHSPHLVNEPLTTFCVSGSVYHQCSQSRFRHSVGVCLT